jgi:hypothetical protein
MDARLASLAASVMVRQTAGAILWRYFVAK